MNIVETIWAAVKSEHGVVIGTNNPEAYKREFYSLRRKLREAGDLSWDCIVCKTAPQKPQSEIWLIKKGQDNGEERSAGTTESNPKTIQG